MDKMKTSEMVGKKVVDLNGFLIGKVKDVTFDEKSWQVQSLDLQLETKVAQEFNLKKPLRSTQVSLVVEHVQGIGDGITLKISKDKLMELGASSRPQ